MEHQRKEAEEEKLDTAGKDTIQSSCRKVTPLLDAGEDEGRETEQDDHVELDIDKRDLTADGENEEHEEDSQWECKKHVDDASTEVQETGIVAKHIEEWGYCLHTLLDDVHWVRDGLLRGEGVLVVIGKTSKTREELLGQVADEVAPVEEHSQEYHVEEHLENHVGKEVVSPRLAVNRMHHRADSEVDDKQDHQNTVHRARQNLDGLRTCLRECLDDFTHWLCKVVVDVKLDFRTGCHLAIARRRRWWHT